AKPYFTPTQEKFILVVDNLCLSFGQLVASIPGFIAAYATPADDWTAPWAHNPHKVSRRVTRLA
ncbi:MAG: hypothetical protein VW103_09540, partial [Halieaceae bacterium]